MEEESKIFETERKECEELVNKYSEIISTMTIENVNEIMEQIKSIDNHILTSEKEIKAHFKKKIEELNLVWNKETKQYEVKQEG